MDFWFVCFWLLFGQFFSSYWYRYFVWFVLTQQQHGVQGACTVSLASWRQYQCHLYFYHKKIKFLNITHLTVRFPPVCAVCCVGCDHTHLCLWLVSRVSPGVWVTRVMCLLFLVPVTRRATALTGQIVCRHIGSCNNRNHLSKEATAWHDWSKDGTHSEVRD